MRTSLRGGSNTIVCECWFYLILLAELRAGACYSWDRIRSGCLNRVVACRILDSLPPELLDRVSKRQEVIRPIRGETNAKARCVYPSSHHGRDRCVHRAHHIANRCRPRGRPLRHRAKSPSGSGGTLVLPCRSGEEPQVLVPVATRC